MSRAVHPGIYYLLRSSLPGCYILAAAAPADARLGDRRAEFAAVRARVIVSDQTFPCAERSHTVELFHFLELGKSCLDAFYIGKPEHLVCILDLPLFGRSLVVVSDNLRIFRGICLVTGRNSGL